MAHHRELHEVGTQVEQLLGELGLSADIRVHRQAEELVRLLTRLYGDALARIVDVVASEGGALHIRLTADSLVASVLALHGHDGRQAADADTREDALAPGQDPREVSSQVENLLGELASSRDTRIQEQVEEIAGLLTQLYGDTLARIVGIVAAEGGDDLRARFIEDDLIASVLILHDLHPEETIDRVQRALERVRPYLGSHAGGVHLLGIDDEAVVHLQLEGNCDGCPSSSATVTYAIEGAINELAPEVSGVEVVDSSANGSGGAHTAHGASGTQSAVIPVGSLFRECPVPDVPAPEDARP